MNALKLAVVGATGLVGRTMLQVLTERKIEIKQLLPVASPKSVGLLLDFQGRSWPITAVADAILQQPDVVLFSAGSAVSREWALAFTAAGSIVIDNSSAWRMDPEVPLIVPEVNPADWQFEKLVANPNCATIQLVCVLAPLARVFGLKRVIVSTYQAVSGTGQAALMQLQTERSSGEVSGQAVYPHPIDGNVLPQCDIFWDNGYTREEMKIIQESRKILGMPDLAITATAVRVPVAFGHSESVNIETELPFELSAVHKLLAQSSGVVVQDDPSAALYPMPLTAAGTDSVYVGRIRRDETVSNGLNMWIVADNLRKGAATNAVQLLQLWQQRCIKK
jgi:aspartate-semialdehyde dehydrogenase